MIIVGLVGFIGSGKDIVADYLVDKYGFRKFTMSDIIKEELKKLNKPINREEMQKLSIEYKAKHGNSVWAKKSIEYIKKNKWQKAVISGLRDTQEIPVFKSAGKFILVFIDAKLDVRLSRLIKRASEKDVASKEELIVQEKREMVIFDLYRDYKKYYDYKIENNTTLETLKKEIEEFAKKYEINK